MSRNPAKDYAAAWEANAIAECRKDPELASLEAAGALCITCMMPHPCFCDERATLPKMRAFYEANRRTAFRAEPVLKLNWGEKGDGLMDELYRIATEPFRREIERLRDTENARLKEENERLKGECEYHKGNHLGAIKVAEENARLRALLKDAAYHVESENDVSLLTDIRCVLEEKGE